MIARRNTKNWFILAMLFALMVAVVTPDAPAAPAKHRTLRMMVGAEVDHMDRALIATQAGEPVWENVLEPLVGLGKAGEPIPMLATSWEKSADLTRWRFYLRKGVKFHNGADFTARDVVETAKHYVDVKDVSLVYARVPFKEAVAIDDYTVDLIFVQPQPLLLINIRSFLICPTAIARNNWEMAKTIAIGTGPYRFVEWKKGQYIKLIRFEGYWGPKPQIDDVQIIFRAEPGVRLAGLMAGEADWVYGLGPEQASRAPKTVTIPSPETVWIRFDESVQKDWTKKDPIFADKRLRLAVEYAIDRQALLGLYGGFGTPSLGQFASPGDFGFNPNLKSRPYDLAKAKALVSEAGAVGKTVTVAGSVDRWSKDREVAEAVAYMIEQTGLKVKLMLMPWSEFVKYQKTQGPDRAYMTDIFIFPSDALMEVESRGQKIFMENQIHYALNDLEPTRLYKEELAERDIIKREEKLRNVWVYVYEQAHYVPIFKLQWIWGIAPNLEWQPALTGIPYVPDMRFAN